MRINGIGAMISRRYFLCSLGGIFAFIGLFTRSHHRQRDLKKVSFVVAGARFQPIPSHLTSGDTVLLIKGIYHGEICYKVTTINWQAIGFVPINLLPRIELFSGGPWEVTVRDHNALPWEKYIVTCG